MTVTTAEVGNPVAWCHGSCICLYNRTPTANPRGRARRRGREREQRPSPVVLAPSLHSCSRAGISPDFLCGTSSRNLLPILLAAHVVCRRGGLVSLPPQCTNILSTSPLDNCCLPPVRCTIWWSTLREIESLSTSTVEPLSMAGR